MYNILFVLHVSIFVVLTSTALNTLCIYFFKSLVVRYERGNNPHQISFGPRPIETP